MEASRILRRVEVGEMYFCLQRNFFQTKLPLPTERNTKYNVLKERKSTTNMHLDREVMSIARQTQAEEKGCVSRERCISFLLQKTSYLKNPVIENVYFKCIHLCPWRIKCLWHHSVNWLHSNILLICATEKCPVVVIAFVDNPMGRMCGKALS